MLFKKLKKFANHMKLQLYALYLASKDPAMPRKVKWLIVVVVAYALSPIDLIPDFIPVIGYLDELILLPIGIYIAVKFIPDKLWLECLIKARKHPIRLPNNVYAASVIIVCWIAIVSGLSYGFWHWINH